MKKIVIAIDGYSACGKSTLARQLAQQLHYTYIDSGAMYRAITLYLIKNNIDTSDKNAITCALKYISMEFIPDKKNGHADLWLNNENVESQIREIAIAGKVSEIAAIPEIRQFAVTCQRNMRQDKGIVMDGRDIGTAVFPDAELKLFMTADIEVRVERRYQEMLAKNVAVSRQEIKENLLARDYMDTHRTASPLRQAQDAIIIDNTHLTEEEQLQYALDLVKRILQ
jgi:cytidylate kinase